MIQQVAEIINRDVVTGNDALAQAWYNWGAFFH